MPPSLLPSQLATLEPLQADEEGVALDIDQAADAIVGQAIDHFDLPTNPLTKES